MFHKPLFFSLLFVCIFFWNVLNISFLPLLFSWLHRNIYIECMLLCCMRVTNRNYNKLKNEEKLEEERKKFMKMSSVFCWEKFMFFTFLSCLLCIEKEKMSLHKTLETKYKAKKSHNFHLHFFCWVLKQRFNYHPFSILCVIIRVGKMCCWDASKC